MTVFIVVATVVVIALIAFFALRASRSAVPVVSSAEIEARALDEGIIVGDVIPIGVSEDAPVVASMPSDVIDDGPTAAIRPDTSSPPDAAPPPDLAPFPASKRADVRWARRFEPADGGLDDLTRLDLLHDLGIVRAPWGVPLLAQAYEEEPAVEHRRAALRSLAAYRHPDTQSTFEVALHSDDDDERAIAEHAITALQIRAALPS